MQATVYDLSTDTASVRELDAAELAALVAAAPAPENPDLVRLREIDSESQLTPRAFRELVMLVTEGFRQATGGVLDLSVIPGVAVAFAKEAEAIAIRERLKQAAQE